MTHTVLLGDIATVKNGKSNSQDAIIDGQYPFFDRSQVVKSSNRYLFDTSAIIIPGEGKDFLPRIFKGKFDLHQRAYAIQAKSDADINYLFYAICNSREYLARTAVGSTVKSLRKPQIERMPIILPNLSVQREIADILGTIDEKIVSNRKMNDTLEKMGQGLFKKYIITSPEAKGVSLEDICTLERGVEPGSKNYSTEKSEGSVPFLRVGDLSQRSSNLYVSIDLTKGKIARPDDILVSFDGAPGLVGIGFSGCYSSGIRKITPKNEGVSKAYLYFLMKSPKVQEVIDRYAEGTTIKHASKSISHIIAPYVADNEVNVLLSIAFEQLINNIKEIENLTSLRDSLLPRLISGKIKL